METLKVLSIDIGIINLGFVYAEITIGDSLESGSKYKSHLLNENYLLNKSKENIRIIDCNRINITKVKHRNVPFCNCKLHHDNCIPDYLDHFIQDTPYFQECDVLIIERQPPIGITNVQDLLFTKFRGKVLLISPVSVHKYFNLNVKGINQTETNYELRKIKSISIAEEYLLNFSSFMDNTRKHDISDAMLMIIYYYKKRMENFINSKSFKHELNEFEQFRFV